MAWERLDNQRHCEYIDNLWARLENNNDELIFALRGSIAELEEENEMAAWTESSLRNKISLLKEQVESSNILSLESNSRLREKIWDLYWDIDKLQSQIRYLQASLPVEKTAGKRDNYLSDDNKSLFSNSDDDGST